MMTPPAWLLDWWASARGWWPARQARSDSLNSVEDRRTAWLCVSGSVVAPWLARGLSHATRTHSTVD
jgi:hypothetical protein